MNYTPIFFVIFSFVLTVNASKFEMVIHGNNCEFISNDEAIFRVSGQFSEDSGADFSTHVSPSALFLFMTDMIDDVNVLPPCDVNVKITRIDSNMKEPKVDTIVIDHKDIKSFGEAVDTIFMKLANEDIFEMESLEMARKTVKNLKIVE